MTGYQDSSRSNDHQAPSNSAFSVEGAELEWNIKQMDNFNSKIFSEPKMARSYGIDSHHIDLVFHKKNKNLSFWARTAYVDLYIEYSSV